MGESSEGIARLACFELWGGNSNKVTKSLSEAKAEIIALLTEANNGTA